MLAGISVVLVDGMTHCQDARSCLAIEVDSLMDWHRIAAKGTFNEFKTALTAVLEHHFDNHEHSGSWCKAKGKPGEETKESSLRFRWKTKNAAMYEHVKILHEEFMEEDQLRQLFHSWDTNAVKGFNKLITKFLPKDLTFCKTIENCANPPCHVTCRIENSLRILSRSFGASPPNDKFPFCGLPIRRSCPRNKSYK